jgi:outer membrane protein OmpA-like peptidoglycan-associated protein
VNKVYPSREELVCDLEKTIGKDTLDPVQEKIVECIINECVVQKEVIYFRFDQDTVENLSDYPDQLETLQQWLKKYQHLTEKGKVLHIEGHTDSRGTDEYNEDLSKKRAEAVYQYLMNPDNQFNLKWEWGKNLIVRWFGEQRLASKGTDEESHQQNRRVELYIE